jgi:ribosome-associated heat shock protein Hsp15
MKHGSPRWKLRTASFPVFRWPETFSGKTHDQLQTGQPHQQFFPKHAKSVQIDISGEQLRPAKARGRRCLPPQCLPPDRPYHDAGHCRLLISYPPVSPILSPYLALVHACSLSACISGAVRFTRFWLRRVHRDGSPCRVRVTSERKWGMTGLRIDKWLWAARFFKTRALASQACELGRVTFHGNPVKPSREVRLGDLLHVRNGSGDFEIKVLLLSNVRGPAAVAQTLYAETEAGRQQRLKLREERKLTPQFDFQYEGRPSKRDRRELDRLRGRD